MYKPKNKKTKKKKKTYAANRLLGIEKPNYKKKQAKDKDGEIPQ